MGAVVSTLAFPAPDKEWSRANLLRRGERADDQLVFLTTRSGYKIPAVHIVRRRASHGKFTIVYSHGNAEDVGLSLPYLDHLSECCDCNVLAYEYCGYSIAEGEASETNCYECIDAAYRYLVEGRGHDRRTTPEPVDPSRIVLFGRSLGTGPTVDLASRLLSKTGETGCVAGVILQSPLESAGRCILSEAVTCALYPLDLFRSYEKIETLAPVPVFIMHGLNDTVVPCSSGKALYASLTEERARRRGASSRIRGDDTERKNAPPVDYPPKWIPGVGHNDMPEFDCMNEIAKFLHFLEQRRQRR